jgi:hypothetical protein
MGSPPSSGALANPRSWRSLPRPYRSASAGIVALTLLSLVSFMVASIYGRARSEIVHLTGSRTPATLTAARGDVVYFRVGYRSIGGMWAASDGLHIRLGDRTLQVMQPKDEDWGDTISYATEIKEGTELATFRVPRFPGTDHLEIEGSITGTLVSPQRETGGFTDVVSDIDSPIVLEVVSEAEAGGLHSSKTNYIPGVILRYSLAAMVLWVTPGLVVVARRRRAQARARRAAGSATPKVKLDRKARIGVAFGIFCGLILVALFAYAIMQGLSKQP